MHRLHRLHTARSILITGTSCIHRAFGVSARVFDANSDRDPPILIPSYSSFIAEIVQNPHARHYSTPASASKRRKKEKQSKKKKVEAKGKHGSGATIELARASLAGFDAKRTGVLQSLSESSEETVPAEVWPTGWGEDGTLSVNGLCLCFHPISL